MVIDFEAEVPFVCKLLNEAHARYLVVGGCAVNLHGLPRSTKDVDLFVGRDPENIEKVLKALEGLTWGLAREIDPEEVARKPFTIIGDQPRVDLLTRVAQIAFDEALARRCEVEIDGVRIPFASLEDLIRIKQASSRLQDQADLENLLQMQALERRKAQREGGAPPNG